MAWRSDDFREHLRLAIESLSRYKLRTSLSVLGVVLGVAAVIAMMSVSEGAARESIAQVEALGLDNLVVRGPGAGGISSPRGLQASDADRAASLVPMVRAVSPLVDRYLRVAYGNRAVMTPVLGVSHRYQGILRLRVGRGRFIAATDERGAHRRSVLGAALARELFGYRDPVGDFVRIDQEYYEVVGVLSDQRDVTGGNSLAWRDISRAVIVPLSALSRRTLGAVPHQPVDEIWLQVLEGERAEQLGGILARAIGTLRNNRDFTLVVPRELLAQRYQTQRTFSVVVGSIAALALIVGGIGIMNIMLTSVVERTMEIGVRRTVGATRRDLTLQFLIEAALMTVAGGGLGVVLGVGASWVITAYAGWATYVSLLAVALAVGVSLAVGLIFGIYPAVKASRMNPVDALRYE
jgi:putative ABC transport system permease protein